MTADHDARTNRAADGASEQAEYADKVARLRRMVRETGGLAVAFSGGVDSTLLVAVARQELGDRALAVTALSPTYPGREQSEAAELAARIGVNHEMIESNELEIPGFADNPVNRCYFCKRELFQRVQAAAGRRGIRFLADGSNADDLLDHRPGRAAAREQGVLSPLLEAGMTKADVRRLSRELGLPTADKPSFACLASRFPYGMPITEEKLSAVDRVETALREMGFRQVRVRHHGDTARIELDAESLPSACAPDVRGRIVAACKAAGYTYVALDLEGYRTGSMNEALAR